MRVRRGDYPEAVLANIASYDRKEAQVSDVDKANKQARQAAQTAGHNTYLHQVVDHWPACTDCGSPIRREVKIPSTRLHGRGCNCPGVIWTVDFTGGHVSGWKKLPAESIGQ